MVCEHKVRYRQLSVILSAGERRDFQMPGNFFRVLNNDLATAPLISIDEGDEYRVLEGVGFSLGDECKSRQFSLRNDTGSTMTLDFCVGHGTVYDDRSTISGTVTVAQESAVDIAPASSISTPAAVTVTTTAALAIAANTSRKGVIIRNNGPFALCVGDTNINYATERGIILEVGESIVLPTTALIWADGAGTTTLSYMELS